MKKHSFIKAVVLTAAFPFFQGAAAGVISHLTMDLDGAGQITDVASGAKFKVYGAHTPENVYGADGKALRFDGYSTYAQGDLSGTGTDNLSGFTASLWVAPETYPIVKHDEATTEKIILAGTLDEAQRQGWAFQLGSTGKYSFACYSGGWKVEIEAPEPLLHYEWSLLTVTVDEGSHKVSLYRNGQLVKEGNSVAGINNAARTLYIGKGAQSESFEGFYLNAFNGIMDDLLIYDEAINIASLTTEPENPADLRIPAQRFENDYLRPRYHGMPAAGWTNESHGMTYANDKFHVFFQKNANGPYMSRLHWGHISSPDLINWTEEKIALFPDTKYDVKGCWSGCVFTDDVITGGKPNIIYTGVDYVRAYIAQATPDDDDLIEWTKNTRNPIINGKPAGLSDDFRDPYFFRNGNDAYLIVGTSKDGVGATTLHKYNPAAQAWTNNAGDIFFAGSSKTQDGTFWEMPNITPMDNGKWLFTTTPQGTGVGVRTLYWTGSINADGTFNPDAASATPRGVELISKDGYGLLSPTIYNHEGKTIVIGIVPDKLPSSQNYSLGWAHCYSLPREWSLDSQGNLLQKPYEGLRNARPDEGFSQTDFTLSGSRELEAIDSRYAEVLGSFTVGNSPFGFNFLKNGNSQAKLRYIPSANMLTVDLTGLDRISNDSRSYNGLYSCVLPQAVAAGSEMTINMFIDGSVLDIFINDKWATSIRVFPTSREFETIEAVAEGEVKVNSLQGWSFYERVSGIKDVMTESPSRSASLNVYDLHGRCLRSDAANFAEASEGLPAGIYVIGGKKIIVR